ncbi:inner membrane protein [Escherichia coli]|nr:inner membrane protein [Escherichia coli]
MPDATLIASYQALYYPSSAEKIGQFSLPAVRMPYRALGSNLLRRFMQRTAFHPK